MESAHSCFFPLAVESPSVALDRRAFTSMWATSPRKTRVGGSRCRASGRLSRRARRRPINTPGSRACAYKTASGRHEWLNRDPLGDDGSMVYAIAKIEPRIEPRSAGELGAMAEAVLDPLSMFTRVNLNLYGAVGNNPVSNVDPFGLDFASCYADCIEKYRSPIDRSIGEICNAGLNKAVGSTGRTGVGGTPPHPTTWQHKVGSKFGSVGSKVGKVAGRAAVVLTIFDGFFDLGLLGGCAAACAGE